MGLRSNWERDPQFGNIVLGAFTPVLAKYSKSSVRRLSFRGRTAVPLHAFCPDVGPKWSRSPLLGSQPRSVEFLPNNGQTFHNPVRAGLPTNPLTIRR